MASGILPEVMPMSRTTQHSGSRTHWIGAEVMGMYPGRVHWNEILRLARSWSRSGCHLADGPDRRRLGPRSANRRNSKRRSPCSGRLARQPERRLASEEEAGLVASVREEAVLGRLAAIYARAAGLGSREPELKEAGPWFVDELAERNRPSPGQRPARLVASQTGVLAVRDQLVGVSCWIGTVLLTHFCWQSPILA